MEVLGYQFYGFFDVFGVAMSLYALGGLIAILSVNGVGRIIGDGLTAIALVSYCFVVYAIIVTLSSVAILGKIYL